MCRLIDPVAGFAIPHEWLGRSGLSLPELKRRIDSGLYALTASGTLLKRGLSTGTISAAAAKAAVLSIAERAPQVSILTPLGIRVKVHTTSADGWARAQKPRSDHSKDVTEGLIFEAEACKADEIRLSPGEGIGIVKKHIRIPVFGLGAIRNTNIAQVMQAGADGIAMISAILVADDIQRAAELVNQQIIEAAK